MVYNEDLELVAASTSVCSFQTLSFSGCLRGGCIIISKNYLSILTRFWKNSNNISSEGRDSIAFVQKDCFFLADTDIVQLILDSR